jgi:aminoglycoside phosphotransferase (APT) family kinase protein
MRDDELGRLRGWLAEQGVPFDGPGSATLLAGGRSHLTYRLEDAAGRAYVLRRPPQGHAESGAHDVGREHGILAGLQGTAVPVPELFGLCQDPAVLGAPFYVMSHVEGVVLSSVEDGAAYPLGARAAATAGLVDALGAIHELDVDAVGLGGLGRREDYLQRQLARWRRQFHAVTDRELPIIDELADRLAAAAPPQRYTGLVHGDFRFGNLLLGPDGTVRAVIDWELCALGDSLADLGWLTALWHDEGQPALTPAPTGHPGFPTRSAVIAQYEARTGRDVSDIGWYQAFALWRLACIGEGIYARYRKGAMDDASFDVDAQREHVVELAEAAARVLAGR